MAALSGTFSEDANNLVFECECGACLQGVAARNRLRHEDGGEWKEPFSVNEPNQ